MRSSVSLHIATTAICLAWIVASNDFLLAFGVQHDYKDALKKSLMFLEAQRSGKLPKDNRISWRGDSALDDGKSANVDLVGGYYDAGDNVKYGLPMAFTITTLAWSAIAFRSELKHAGEIKNVEDAIKWGTDYFLKAAAKKNTLWVQVGDPVADHKCWIRPENMRTPRTLYKIDESTPGTEIAAETAAALAASSIVFRNKDKIYAKKLLNKAKMLYEFAKKHQGTYDGECPFYCSNSGFKDELLWAATWLYKATKKDKYKSYITGEATSASVTEFNWDLKFAAAQVILTDLNVKSEHNDFKQQIEDFICHVHPDTSSGQMYYTPGGLLFVRDGANTQYVATASLIFVIYSDIIRKRHETVQCGDKQLKPSNLMKFAKGQMDYILGSNPRHRSYMVGFGTNPPKQAHHRGASVPSMPQTTTVHCGMSFTNWMNSGSPNPNELTGAIVGGPDRYDNFEDFRTDSSKLEPTTYINSCAVGPLAKLAAIYSH